MEENMPLFISRLYFCLWDPLNNSIPQRSLMPRAVLSVLNFHSLVISLFQQVSNAGKYSAEIKPNFLLSFMIMISFENQFFSQASTIVDRSFQNLL